MTNELAELEAGVVAIIREALSYDPETGELRWKVTLHSRQKAGTFAGSVQGGVGRPYYYITLYGIKLAAHSIIWALQTGRFPKPEHYIDHRDGDGLNNRWENLREASPVQNNHNRRFHRNNTSGYRGVWRRPDRERSPWRAEIRVGCKRIGLGSYATPEEASTAYEAAAAQYFGEWRRSASALPRRGANVAGYRDHDSEPLSEQPVHAKARH